jgi:hypothetical protein
MSYCPQCGAPGVYRERRQNGNDRCQNDHVYPSKESQNTPKRSLENELRDLIQEWRKTADNQYKFYENECMCNLPQYKHWAEMLRAAATDLENHLDSR